MNQLNLQNAIDSQFGTGKATVTDNGDGTYFVTFKESGREYNISNSNISNTQKILDANPGELSGDGTEKSPYLIESIEDLVYFASDVSNGNTYSGKYVKLQNSLNFYATSSYVNPNVKNFAGYEGELKTALTTGDGFKGIGTSLAKNDETDKNNSFCGYFDGNNKNISNCYINKNLSDSGNFNMYGFFGAYLYGEVKNLGIIGIEYNIIAENYSTAISGIAGKLYDDGKLNNCYTSGNITLTINGNINANVAGLIDYNRGKIENCHNNISINVKIANNNSSSALHCAGIAINNERETAYIKNSYNSGNILATMQSGIYAQIAGIVRALDYGSVENCYNSGNISTTINNTTTESYIGGIVAKSSSNGFLNNIYNSGEIGIDLEGTQVYSGGIIGMCSGLISSSYNIGNIINIKSKTNCLIGEIAGNITSTATIFNSFYIKNSAYAVNSSNEYNINKISKEQLQDDCSLNILNSNEINWKKDINGKNSGYPILSWQ